MIVFLLFKQWIKKTCYIPIFQALKTNKDEYNESMQKLEEELGSQLGEDDYNDDEISNRDEGPHVNNGMSHISNGEVSTITAKVPNKENGSTVHGGAEIETEKVNSEEQLTTM